MWSGCNSNSFYWKKGNAPDAGKRMRLSITDIRGNIVGRPKPNVDVVVIDCTSLFFIMSEQLY